MKSDHDEVVVGMDELSNLSSACFLFLVMSCAFVFVNMVVCVCVCLYVSSYQRICKSV